ncbi:hypothetical protein FN846DRAFT_929764 [Sphaerosporella brunnea]|uniref:DUF4219 domain-containing protein n=1 Tax=Sphaerosporella brunnea TaxID=1250544 RepID=A0A5J5F9K3_9PEZI|nr:hypothetical protein FN846DRAFT_929764 [Sphaerosporella brunnea]
MPSFHLTSTDTPQLLEIPYLTADNYLDWAPSMQRLLGSQNLWDLISDPSATSSAITTQRQYSATSLILSLVPMSTQQEFSLQHITSPSILWERIKTHYRSSLNPWNIRQQLYSLRLDEDLDGSVVRYALRIDYLVLKYNFSMLAAERMGDAELAWIYVHGLPDSREWREKKEEWTQGENRLEYLRDPRKLKFEMLEFERGL